MNIINLKNTFNIPRTTLGVIFFTIFISMFLASCDQSDNSNGVKNDKSTSSEKAPQEKIKALGFDPERWPKRPPSPPLDPDIESRASKILAKMSIEEKVGQIIQAELKYVSPDDVKTYHLGSILNGGGTTPNNDKYASAEDWLSLAEEYYQASMDTSDGNIAIPVLWGSDAVHGNNNVYGATLFPHNIGLGAARDSDLIYRIGQATALEMIAIGVNWTFAPTVAVVRDIRWGRTYESYSEDPKIVKDYAKAMVLGLQGESKKPGYRENNVLATAKHFIGDGGTSYGVDRGDTAVDEQTLIDIHAPGYLAALDANVMTTMASFNSWNHDKLHGHHYLLTEILKERLGFNGFVVGDWNGHMQVPGCTTENCPESIMAGLDLFMVPSDWKALTINTIEAVKSGAISMSRLDDAVKRILRVKLYAGLFDVGSLRERQNVGNDTLIGHPEHRTLAREAVRKTLVLLKNNNAVLPISPKANILVAGDAAHNIGKQAGGWSLSWQGTGNKNEDFPNASSIWDGLSRQINAAGGKALLSPSGDWQAKDFDNGKPDIAIVVYGEEPYAEWHGDITHIEYQFGVKSDLQLLKKLKANGIPVVSVFISGRPLWVNKELNASDAFVAAWLPGSEGEGVADVLLKNKEEKIQHDFVGKLSFSWPNKISQSVLNIGSDNYQPLFPYGYGLSYTGESYTEKSDRDSQLAENTLDESTDYIHSEELQETWLFVSREMFDFQFHLQEKNKAAVVVSGNRAISAEDENLFLMSVDNLAQEDARRIKWKGLRPATVSLKSPRPIDLSAYFEKNSVLRLSIRTDNKPKGKALVSMECENSCDSSFDITPILSELPNDEYHTIQIPLTCFSKNSKSLKQVKAPFAIYSDGELDIVVADIRIKPKAFKAITDNCRPIVN